MNSGYFGFLNIIVINIVEWLFDYLILISLPATKKVWRNNPQIFAGAGSGVYG